MQSEGSATGSTPVNPDSAYAATLLRYSSHYADLLARENSRANGDGSRWGQVEALASLRLELQNIRAALRCALELGSLELLCQLAQHLLFVEMRAGDMREAQSEYEKLYDYASAGEAAGSAEAVSYGLCWAYALCGMGAAHNRLSNLPEASEKLEAAIVAFEAASYPPGLALSMYILSVLRLKTGHSDAAKDLLSGALSLSRELSDRWLESCCHNMLGRLATTTGHHLEARGHYEAGINIQRKAGDLESQAHSLLNLAGTYVAEGDFSQGQQYYEESLALARQVRNLDAEANALMGLGMVHSQARRFDEARQFLVRSKELKTEIGDRIGMEHALVRLAGVESLEGNFAEAQSMLKRCVELQRELSDLYGMGHALNDLGVLSALLDRNEEASSYLLEALAVRQDCHDEAGQCSTLISLGSLAVHSRDWPKAALHLGKALQLAKPLNSPKLLLEGLHALGPVLAAAGRHEAGALLVYGARSLLTQFQDDNPATAMDFQRTEAALLAVLSEAAESDSQIAGWKTRGPAMSLPELSALAEALQTGSADAEA